METLLSAEECSAMNSLYPHEGHFRSHVVMARHGFGKGQYRHFKYPLPDLLGALRTAHFPRLSGVANEWSERMGADLRYPSTHVEFLQLCHEAPQTRAAPLLPQYTPADFNALHQDLHGDIAFPIQVAVLLSEPSCYFIGGEFALTEQRPRMQSSPELVLLREGDAVALAVHDRPVKGTKGTYPVNLRHDGSRLRSGQRHTVGIIFYDAR
jgi:hypothetical protein